MHWWRTDDPAIVDMPLAAVLTGIGCEMATWINGTLQHQEFDLIERDSTRWIAELQARTLAIVR